MPCSRQSCFQNSIPIWFPHCPTWIVMISRGIFFAGPCSPGGCGGGGG
uniref:TUBG2 n=1 Tax=Arundo donax TaxID=35708 RepID=A0A0A9EEL6_ARUDO